LGLRRGFDFEPAVVAAALRAARRLRGTGRLFNDDLQDSCC